MKKISVLLLVFALFTLTLSGVASAAEIQKSIRVWVGEQEVKFDIPPVVANNTTFVEFKGTLFTALNYTIAYDSKTKTITSVSGTSSIKINLTTGQATVDGQSRCSANPAARSERPYFDPTSLCGRSNRKACRLESSRENNQNQG